MGTTRKAILRVSRPLLEALLPDFRTVAVLRYGELVEPRLGPSTDVAAQVIELAAPFHRALKLPASCHIAGISVGYLFDRDEVAFRIESPDFVETPEGGPLPEVTAVYQHRNNFLFTSGQVKFEGSSGYFLCWSGPAVETRNTKQDAIRQGVKAARVAYTPGGLPCEGCGSLLLGRLTEMRLCPDCQARELRGLKLRPIQPGEKLGEELVEADLHDPQLLQKVIKDTRATLNGLPVHFTDEVSCYRGNAPCWRCHSPTTRRLPDDNAECQGCAEKSLL